MVGSDEVAFGVLDGLANTGISVPDDLLLTGFDGLPQASWAGYDLTTLVQTTDVLVARAIDVLMEPGGDPQERPSSIVVAGTIRFGRTTRKPNA